MFYLLKVVTSLILPPGIFLLALLVLAVRVHRQHRRLAYLLFGTVALWYVTTCPWFGDFLIASLERRVAPAGGSSADVIVYLGAGSVTHDTPDLEGEGGLFNHSSARLLGTLRLQKKLRLPVLISAGFMEPKQSSEGQIAKRYLVEAGIPEEQILVDDESRTTRETARYVRRLIEAGLYRRPIVVTSAFHMTRTLHLFAGENVAVDAFPTDYMSNSDLGAGWNWTWLLPQAGASEAVRVALKEYLGMLQ